MFAGTLARVRQLSKEALFPCFLRYASQDRSDQRFLDAASGRVVCLFEVSGGKGQKTETDEGA